MISRSTVGNGRIFNQTSRCTSFFQSSLASCVLFNVVSKTTFFRFYLVLRSRFNSLIIHPNCNENFENMVVVRLLYHKETD